MSKIVSHLVQWKYALTTQARIVLIVPLYAAYVKPLPFLFNHIFPFIHLYQISSQQYHIYDII